MQWVQKTRVKLFRMDPPVGKLSGKNQKVEWKKMFFDCVRKPDLGFGPKRPFSTDKSDCVRNGLTTIITIQNVSSAHAPEYQI